MLGVLIDLFDKFDLGDKCEGDQFHLTFSKAEDFNCCLGFYPMSKAVGVEFSVDHTQDFGFSDSHLLLVKLFSL